MTDIKMVYEETGRMCADIFTKAFTNAASWKHACALMQIVDPKGLSSLTSSPDLNILFPHALPQKSGGGVPNNDADNDNLARSSINHYASF